MNPPPFAIKPLTPSSTNSDRKDPRRSKIRKDLSGNELYCSPNSLLRCPLPCSHFSSHWVRSFVRASRIVGKAEVIRRRFRLFQSCHALNPLSQLIERSCILLPRAPNACVTFSLATDVVPPLRGSI